MKTSSFIPAVTPFTAMSRRVQVATLLVLATLSFQFSMLAQGTAFTYQGRLTDGASPASGIYDLRFTIYDLDTGGSAIGGPLTNSPVTVSNGLFTVTLDFGAGVFPGADRWLEIGVRTNGGAGGFQTLSPRQQITPTPYAIFSASVNAAGISGIISSNNIGAGSITTVMLAAGAVGSNQLAAGAVTTAALAKGAVTADKVATVTVPLFVNALTNPTPAVADAFGLSVAAIGNDRVIIGASGDDTGSNGAGAAYLFSANGTLLTTITNPTPSSLDAFGSAVGSVGASGVLVGAALDDTIATNAGLAYLFSANGTLVTTFVNPFPATGDEFGASLTGVGNDRVLIGAPFDDPGVTDSGAAYLFDVDGTLLTTFANPTPAIGDAFGYAVAALGDDRVLISARFDDTSGGNAGIAYLFSTNGTLLATFINPAPAGDFFGTSITAVGIDRVLIGSPVDNTGATGAGAAYLFSTNGTLLKTFISPEPLLGDEFGNSVAGVGSDRVLIGAPRNAGGSGIGEAYLFDVNGTFLTSFSNPAGGVNNDLFGHSVAALGSDGVVIGAFQDDTGATGAGAAYLFKVDTFTPGLLADGVRDGAVTSESIASGAVTAANMFTDLNLLALTIPNPTPAGDDSFGISVAALGNDRVLIGAQGDNTGGDSAGAAYLFGIDGALLITFTNPAPAAGDIFGASVSAFGTDRVLIGASSDNTGAPDAGAAYLFSSNGALLATFTNPAPAIADLFGNSVAAVGTDRVLIGAFLDDVGVTNAGAAYLFRTNGTLLTTFTNPTPVAGDRFGGSVAAMGSARVLIGADGHDSSALDAGAAYLFSTNGALLMTFNNPSPALSDQFGHSVVALGNDRVLIGAPIAAKAYLFSTNGALLETLTSPALAGDGFGISVAAAGNDSVLIGAWEDAGAAYLLTTNGALIAAFTNPTPALNDRFGGAVAAVGNNRVLIAADGDDTGATDAGSAYLFTLEPFSPGVIADGVRSGSITLADFDSTIGVWTRSGDNVYRTNGNVGIGTTTPSNPLHIAAAIPVMVLHDTGPASTQSGYVDFRNDSFTETAWVGYGTEGDPDFSIVNTRGDIVLLPLGGGNVGIGTGTPGFTLHVNGTAGKPGGGSWSVASDERLKKNIQPLAGALDKLLALHGVSFEYMDPAKINELSGERMGLLAQEVEKVFPDWVETGPDGYKRVTVRGLEALVVEALRELKQKQDARLADELKRRDAENAELKRELGELKKLVNGLAQKLEGGL